NGNSRTLYRVCCRAHRFLSGAGSLPKATRFWTLCPSGVSGGRGPDPGRRDQRGSSEYAGGRPPGGGLYPNRRARAAPVLAQAVAGTDCAHFVSGLATIPASSIPDGTAASDEFLVHTSTQVPISSARLTG